MLGQSLQEVELFWSQVEWLASQRDLVACGID